MKLHAVKNEESWKNILHDLEGAAAADPHWKEGLHTMYQDWYSLARCVDLYPFRCLRSIVICFLKPKY